MENSQLYHHGILGMKWGVRRFQNKDGSLTSDGKRHLEQNSKAKQGNNKKKKGHTTNKGKSINELSDDELRKRINRLELEKRYEALSKKEQKAKMFDGKRFVTQVLENSGKVVATQLSTYVMGNMVNKVAQKNIINVKKD
ncbi:Uncharacterised protein [uncultured Clostridium sp.]|nr:Uncharacterised protein [uncultured Clostridium sp.]